MTDTPGRNRTRGEVSRIADQLREAGFPLVVVEPARRGTKDRLRPDIVAYEAVNGELTATTVVEIKPHAQEPAMPASQLAQLAYAREALGTTRHYLVIGDEWFQADDALIETYPTRIPAPMSATPPVVRVADQHLIDDLVAARAWQIGNSLRDGAARDDGMSLVAALAANVVSDPLTIGDDVQAHIDQHVLAASVTSAIREIAGRGHSVLTEFASPPAIADVIVRLLGDLHDGSAIDPFCGLGSFLWSVGEHAHEHGHQLRLEGRDINNEAITVARSVAELLEIDVEFHNGDVFAEPEVHPGSYDYVVTAPPWGTRVESAATEAWLTPQARRRGELVAIARVHELLVDGGRAALHLPASILRVSHAEGVRRFLSEHCTVLAIIALPTGAMPFAGSGSVLFVFDKTPARHGHETFIAQLGDDWEEQLQPDGDTMQGYAEYLAARGR